MMTPIPTRLRLNNRVIDEMIALPPDKRSRRDWDTTVPDLCVQFSRAGTPSFVLRYTRLDGADGDYAIGPVAKITIDSARTVARTVLNDLQAYGIDPVEARREARQKAKTPELSTFADIAEAFMASKASLRPGQKPLDEVFFLRRYVLPVLGPRKFDKITVQCVMDLVTAVKIEVGDRRRRKGANGKTTANACHRAIKRVYRWACNKEIATKNPGDFPCMFKMTREKRRGRLNETRFAQFWKEISDRFFTRNEVPKAGTLAILLFLVTLQRPIDVARAKLAHINLRKRIWIIPEDYTKTGYKYFIPLSDQAVRLIQIAMKRSDGEFLFPSNRQHGPHLDEHALTVGWIRARKRLLKDGRLDDEDVELYDGRRFGRTQLRAKLGYTNEVAEAVINHVGLQHDPSQLYDVEEMLPHMTEAQEKWGSEVDQMLSGGLVSVLEVLEARDD